MDAFALTVPVFSLTDLQSLRSKSTHINRAPVMTAWATVVAERLGFKREEALSIGEQPSTAKAGTRPLNISRYRFSVYRNERVIKRSSAGYFSGGKEP